MRVFGDLNIRVVTHFISKVLAQLLRLILRLELPCRPINGSCERSPTFRSRQF